MYFGGLKGTSKFVSYKLTVIASLLYATADYERYCGKMLYFWVLRETCIYYEYVHVYTHTRIIYIFHIYQNMY